MNQKKLVFISKLAALSPKEPDIFVLENELSEIQGGQVIDPMIPFPSQIEGIPIGGSNMPPIPICGMPFLPMPPVIKPKPWVMK